MFTIQTRTEWVPSLLRWEQHGRVGPGQEDSESHRAFGRALKEALAHTMGMVSDSLQWLICTCGDSCVFLYYSCAESHHWVFFVCVWARSCYVAQPGLEFEISCLSLLSAGITCMSHQLLFVELNKFNISGSQKCYASTDPLSYTTSLTLSFESFLRETHLITVCYPWVLLDLTC
jgi:hypothetical protein